MMATPPLSDAKTRFLDRYGIEAGARELAGRELAEFAQVLLRIASRIAREGTSVDSPD